MLITGKNNAKFDKDQIVRERKSKETIADEHCVPYNEKEKWKTVSVVKDSRPQPADRGERSDCKVDRDDADGNKNTKKLVKTKDEQMDRCSVHWSRRTVQQLCLSKSSAWNAIGGRIGKKEKEKNWTEEKRKLPSQTPSQILSLFSVSLHHVIISLCPMNLIVFSSEFTFIISSQAPSNPHGQNWYRFVLGWKKVLLLSHYLRSQLGRLF